MRTFQFLLAHTHHFWIKNMKSKVYQSFSDLSCFPFKALQFGVLFSIKPRQRNKYPNVGTRYKFLLKIQKKTKNSGSKGPRKKEIATNDCCNR